MFLDHNPQLNKNGELHHLLSIEGLPGDGDDVAITRAVIAMAHGRTPEATR